MCCRSSKRSLPNLYLIGRSLKLRPQLNLCYNQVEARKLVLKAYMSKQPKITTQSYPRIEDSNRSDVGCVDDTQLIPHQKKFVDEEFKQLIREAILYAGQKSRREILQIPSNAAPAEIEKLLVREGKELFRYFHKYVGDPAATAHQLHGKHYRNVAIEQFRNRTLQKERMNSGWRYQRLSVRAAQASGRFKSVSDISAAEGDFTAVIEFLDGKRQLNLYVSVKNRRNTMGGQDWPKAIAALERHAQQDKNRVGPYCCVFGIAMDRGQRYIKVDQRTGRPHSDNTEIWLSDYFWPFFTNTTYEEIMRLVLEVLTEDHSAAALSTEVEVPETLIESFGSQCRTASLIDENGFFNDPFKLVQFFCNELASARPKKV